MIGPEEEARVLALLRGGPRERDAGMRELFERTRASLFGLALRMTGRSDLADDAVQETLVDVLRGVDGFQGEARLTTWLFRIAVRASMRVAARAEGRSRALPEEMSRVAESPAQLAEQRDSAARILAAIASLPAGQRAVLALSALEGLPQTEVARILGVPPGTVYSRLHSARRMLRERLERA